MIIFDLEHTIFNNSLFKEDEKIVFEKFGIRSREFWKSFYESCKVDYIKGSYYLDSHLNSLKELTSKQKEDIKNNLYTKAQERGSEYLYNDVLSFLSALKDLNIKTILMLKGDRELKSMKIEAIGIKHNFTDIHYVKEDILVDLKKIISENKPEKIVFISGYSRIIEILNRNLPEIICVFLKRDERYLPADLDVISVNNLNELSHLLKTIQ